MAYRKSNGKLRGRRMEPAVQTLYFTTGVTPAGQATTNYIDLSQIASIVNRRFYRQGINWAVAGIKLISTVNSSVLISKLPDTWVLHNAWTKGFNSWRDQINQAFQDDDVERPRFMDFKVFADQKHHEVGYAANLLPQTFDLTTVPVSTIDASTGKWTNAKIFIPNSTNTPGATVAYDVIATGPNFPGISPVTNRDGVSLIDGYASSRGLPLNPSENYPLDFDDTDGVTPNNWMDGMFNEGNTSMGNVREETTLANNRAPYPFEDDSQNVDTMYPGGANQMTGMQLHDVAVISATTVGGMTYVKGGNFPCGLIRIDHIAGDTAGNIAIQLDLVPGNHRGYMCEPMGA